MSQGAHKASCLVTEAHRRVDTASLSPDAQKPAIEIDFRRSGPNGLRLPGEPLTGIPTNLLSLDCKGAVARKSQNLFGSGYTASKRGPAMVETCRAPRITSPRKFCPAIKPPQISLRSGLNIRLTTFGPWPRG